MNNIDKSEISQKELKRHGLDDLDTQTISKFILLLDKRINLKDHEFTTMSDSQWIKHFRQQLSDYCDSRDYLPQ
jgi:hypothetical protein